MYITAILLLLLLVSLIVSEKKNYTGFSSFSPATTLPLRGLLALLIVSHHLGLKSQIPVISAVMPELGSPIVAAFFFISGYGLCKSYVGKGRSYLDGFLQKRLGKLLPKFLMLSIGMVAVYYFYQSMDLSTQATAMAHGWTPLPNSWFIYAIIYVYFAFFLCATIAKTPKTVGVLFILTTLLYLYLTRYNLQFRAHWFHTIITVNLGYFVALYEKRIDRLMEHKFVFFSALAAILFASFCAMLKTPVAALVAPFRQVWILAMAFSIYAIVRALGVLQWKWLYQAGILSLEIYLVHGIPLWVGLEMGLHNWWLWLFTFAISIPMAILLNRGFDALSRSKRAVNV